MPPHLNKLLNYKVRDEVKRFNGYKRPKPHDEASHFTFPFPHLCLGDWTTGILRVLRKIREGVSCTNPVIFVSLPLPLPMLAGFVGSYGR